MSQETNEAPVRSSILSEKELEDALEFARQYVQRRTNAFRPGTDLEELESAALYGAYMAWLMYDPAFGTQWKTWLCRKINWWIREALRDYGRRRRRSFNEFREKYTLLPLSQIGVDGSDGYDGEGIPLSEKIADPSQRPFEHDVDNKIIIENLLKTLSEQEQMIVRAHYFGGQSRKEIAKDLDLTPTRVGQILRQALARLREVADRDGGFE